MRAPGLQSLALFLLTACGTAVPPPECTTNSDCGPTLACSAGRCEKACSCNPGENVCDEDGNLSRCREDCRSTEPIERCAAGCVDGACLDVCSCIPGYQRCEGDDLVGCTDDCRWSPIEACEFGCDTAETACLVCEPESYRCTGNTLEACHPSGSGWAPIMPCQTTCSEEPEPGCDECACAPGMSRCSTDGTALEGCSEECAWGVLETCEGACELHPTFGARCP